MTSTPSQANTIYQLTRALADAQQRIKDLESQLHLARVQQSLFSQELDRTR
jgi:hypothetical protein